MTQENKELLLRDLCARLPYGVKCQIDTGDADVYADTLATITIDGCVCFMETIDTEDALEYDNIKPYLFPLSSMTEEQKYDFYCRFIENDFDFDDFKEFYFENNEWHKMLTSIDDIGEIIDWFNKNHFDYRGLIEKGLAIDATGLNIY